MSRRKRPAVSRVSRRGGTTPLRAVVLPAAVLAAIGIAALVAAGLIITWALGAQG